MENNKKLLPPIVKCNQAGNNLVSEVADRLLKAEGLTAFGIIEALHNFTKLDDTIAVEESDTPSGLLEPAEVPNTGAKK